MNGNRVNREIESYAALVHGAQAFAYILSYLFHTERQQTKYRVVSAVGAAYHVWSAYKHLRELR